MSPLLFLEINMKIMMTEKRRKRKRQTNTHSNINSNAVYTCYCLLLLLGTKVDTTMHYANTSVQYTAIFHGCNNDNFQKKIFDTFSYFCSKHILWVHVRTASERGGSNEYPQSMFWSKNKKIKYTPVNPSFTI